MDKKEQNYSQSFSMFSLRICSGIMDSVCSAAEIYFMNLPKDCEKQPISCDLFQMQHDGSGGSHLIDTGIKKAGNRPRQHDCNILEKNLELRIISRLYCCV